MPYEFTCVAMRRHIIVNRLSPEPLMHALSRPLSIAIALLCIQLVTAACALTDDELIDDVEAPELGPGSKGDSPYDSSIALAGSALSKLPAYRFTLAYAYNLEAGTRVDLRAVLGPVQAWRWQSGRWTSLGRLLPRDLPMQLQAEGALYLALWPLDESSLLLTDVLAALPDPDIARDGNGADEEDEGWELEDEYEDEPINDDSGTGEEKLPCAVSAKDIKSFIGTPGSGRFDPLARTGVNTFPTGVYNQILSAFRPHYGIGGVTYSAGTAMPNPGLADVQNPPDRFITAAWQASFDVEFNRPIPARCVGFYQRVRLRPYILGRSGGGRPLAAWMSGSIVKTPPRWPAVPWAGAEVNKWYVDTTVSSQRLYSAGNPPSDPTLELSTNDNPLFYGSYNMALYHLEFEMVLVRRELAADGSEKLVALAQIPWSIAAGARGATSRSKTSDYWSWLHMHKKKGDTTVEGAIVSDALPPAGLLSGL